MQGKIEVKLMEESREDRVSKRQGTIIAKGLPRKDLKKRVAHNYKETMGKGGYEKELPELRCARLYRLGKWVFDITFSIIGLILLVPVFIVVAVLLKLDSTGPIFYRQLRVGKGGRLFKIWKFRTMVVDAESRTGATWSRRNDPRITRIGLLLRMYHLDELPQLINVIKGDMSLVGPRPERPEFVTELESVIGGYSYRTLVRPGITGLAQVRYKYDQTLEDVKRKLRFDLYYIRHLCFAMDIRILYRTIKEMALGKLLDV